MPSPQQRRHTLINLLAEDAYSRRELAKRLRCSPRTLHNDLGLLEQRFPGRIQHLRDRQQQLVIWQGPLPHSLTKQIEYLDHWELIALIAARGLFRQPHSTGFSGPLDGAINQLLHQLGVADAAHRIDPRSIEVDRFAACPEQPEDLITALDAVLSGHSLRGTYENRHGVRHEIHILPLRLLLLEGEFHLLAWADNQHPIKDYRLSRFHGLAISHRPPAGAPHVDQPQLRQQVEAHRQATFRTHGHFDHRQRETITLAISPLTIPHVIGRTWGLNQSWDDQPPDLAPGWARLTFTTAGTPAAFHWILSLGAGAIVENPQHLANRIAIEAGAMRSYYRKRKKPPKSTA